MKIDEEAVFTDSELEHIELAMRRGLEKAEAMTLEEVEQDVKRLKPGILTTLSDIFEVARQILPENEQTEANKKSLREMEEAYEGLLKSFAKKAFEERKDIIVELSSILTKITLYRNCKLQTT